MHRLPNYLTLFLLLTSLHFPLQAQETDIMTDSMAMALVQRYDGEFPNKYFQDFLEYTDITEDQFWQVVDSWRQPHIWEKRGNDWRLRHAVYYPEDAVEPLP